MSNHVQSFFETSAAIKETPARKHGIGDWIVEQTGAQSSGARKRRHEKERKKREKKVGPKETQRTSSLDRASSRVCERRAECVEWR